MIQTTNSKTVWIVLRSQGLDSVMQGVFTSPDKMIESVKNYYKNVTVTLDRENNPFRADAHHDYLGNVILWFEIQRLDELKH